MPKGEKSGKHLDRGQRFGWLVVVKRAPQRNPHWEYVCHCDCGRRTIVRGSCLRSGQTTSCGCKRGSRLKGRHDDRMQAMLGKHFGLIEVLDYKKEERTIFRVRCHGCDRVYWLRVKFDQLDKWATCRECNKKGSVVSGMLAHKTTTISDAGVRKRLREGWPIELAMSAPPKTYFRKKPRKTQDAPALPPLRLVR